jgi:hypothetical protein
MLSRSGHVYILESMDLEYIYIYTHTHEAEPYQFLGSRKTITALSITPRLWNETCTSQIRSNFNGKFGRRLQGNPPRQLTHTKTGYT